MVAGFVLTPSIRRFFRRIIIRLLRFVRLLPLTPHHVVMALAMAVGIFGGLASILFRDIA